LIARGRGDIFPHVKDIHMHRRERTAMHTAATATAAPQGVWSWPARAEAWLDARGRKAWVVAIILAFVVFWPAGLALLAYALWSRKMFKTCNHRRHHGHDRSARWAGRDRGVYMASGNTAFDAYKDDALRRLEEEQEAFAAFLQRLRDARDKQEFDSFMEARATRVAADTDTPPAASEAPRNGDY
jgi:hypothetical protein